MTRGEAVNWLINIMSDIGKIEHRDLWHYEQALSEIKELLGSQPEVIACGSGELIVETTGDLISRQAAIRRYCGEHCGCEPQDCGLTMEQDGSEDCDFVRSLKEEPPAQPEHTMEEFMYGQDMGNPEDGSL